MSRAFADNINSFNVSNTNNFTFTTADDESKLLAWLSPLEPQVRHQDICDQRVESVGDWLLETEEFKSWYNGSGEEKSDHAAFFCYGDPGVGKSYMSSVVVDYLCNEAMEQDMAVACFYYDFASREEQSPINMLGSLLKQILSGVEAIPVEITRKFRGQKKVIGGRKLQLPDILNMFPTVSSLRRTFICVDALDECVPKYQHEVFGALGQILQRSPNTRIFMTGRSHILGAMERGLGERATSVLVKPRDGDIVTYLRARLGKDTTPEVMDRGLEDDILRGIPEEISESFLLASLKVEAILRETTIHRRRKRLNGMKDGLGLENAYGATLERIGAQDEEKAKLAMATLMWICHSERPLGGDELCHALAVEIGSTGFNSDNVPATETLLACCQGLIIVDKEASTVRLIHHTLREYLSTDRNLFPRAHSVMAETCLTYLNSDQVKSLSAEHQPGLTDTPFLKYCSRYWGTHAKRELSDHARSLAMKLLGQYESHVAAKSHFEQILGPYDSAELNAPPLFSGLHCASSFGIVEIMAGLLGINGCDTNQRDSAGITPLIWAVRGGYEDAVKLLLGQESIDPDKPDNDGDTPLSWVAAEGHESLIGRLLDRGGISPDKQNRRGTTPLLWAAMEGRDLVVKQLLNREDVNPDTPDNEGKTPLCWAAMKGYESVVKQLLDRKGVNPNMPDHEGKTPLHWAALLGYEFVVKQLLDHEDVNPNDPDNKGRTPLFDAAFNGHDPVVRRLLDRADVSPDTTDNEGKTPLCWAAMKGHESVVKQLLDRKGVNPNMPDNEGRTPLHWTALCGHEFVVKQLLDHEDVNPNDPDNKGRTPLSDAAYNGHDPVVRRLLDRADVNPDTTDNEGKTPLCWAAMKGHESVVKQLLDREDVNPDRVDNEGYTPLSKAVAGGHESVVRQLLDRRSTARAGRQSCGQQVKDMCQ